MQRGELIVWRGNGQKAMETEYANKVKQQLRLVIDRYKSSREQSRDIYGRSVILVHSKAIPPVEKPSKLLFTQDSLRRVILIKIS